MIPKIAHFHWDGEPMSWLRTVSIASFAKFNPDWEIRLLRTHESLRGTGLSYPQKADLTWWLALEEFGGFQVATDIVFFKPVPQEWLEAELCCNTSDGRVFQFAMLGIAPGHAFMSEVVRQGKERVSSGRVSDFQDLGVWLLESAKDHMGPHMELPMSGLCHYDHYTCWDLWDREGTIEFPENAIGCHWYGGHLSTKEHELKVGPADISFPIIRLANSVFP